MPDKKPVTSKPTKPAQPATPLQPDAGPAAPVGPMEAAVAFAAIEREVEALRADDLEAINLDIPRAVAVAVGAAQHLAGLRGQVTEELPRFPIRLFDELGTYALGAWYAHLLALPATTEKQLTVLLDEATPRREDLLVAAEALAHKGHLDTAPASPPATPEPPVLLTHPPATEAAGPVAGWVLRKVSRRGGGALRPGVTP